MNDLSHIIERVPHVALLIAISLTSSACWVPAQTGERMQLDISNIETNLEHTRKEVDEIDAKMSEQRSQLADQMDVAETQVGEVTAILDKLKKSEQLRNADVGVQLDQLIQEVQQLRGAVELADHRLEQIEQRFEGDSSLISRIEKLEQLLAITDTPKTGSSPAPKAVAQKGSKPTPVTKKRPKKAKSGREMLNEAKQLVKAGKVNDARGLYRQIIRKWPKTKGIADDAYFRLGELHYREGKYRDALQEFIKVVDRFPKGAMVDDAYYRIGNCSMKMGNLEDAQIFFQEIINNHKKSPLLKAAQGKLKEVKRQIADKRRGKKKVSPAKDKKAG